MGTPKADLDWHGTPLVAHVASTLRDALGGGPVVVVRAPGQVLPTLPPGVAVAEDARPGAGPLQGVAAGLAAVAAATEAAVVVATDQPWAAAVVPRLLAAREPGDRAVAFAGEPLGALYATALAALAEERLAGGGDTSLRGLLAAAGARLLEPDAEARAALRSLDTPEAYRAAAAPADARP
jgi:molybdopterin-guanine dinucleotide biosynthesis protein A